MTPEQLLTRLKPPTDPIDLVLDTDTYNEIDDQFALVYAAIASDKLRLRAVHAAPFANKRSSGPEDGMEKSYEEILRVLSHLNIPHDQLVYRGSTRFLTEAKDPVHSES
ncbi:MAG: nucleoside hydrolase, partial [Kiritimatiellae bacterium]|nr:nucleoside hydrolase [Kiritimatiellia bacterium]